MGTDFRTLIGLTFDRTQAKSELDRQIKSLQQNAKLALDIELSDKDAKKIIQDQSKMWSNYRKEAVSAITASNREIKEMSKYYKDLEKASLSNKKLADSMELVKTRASGANKGFNAYLQSLKPNALKEFSSQIKEISNSFYEASNTGDKVTYSKATASLGKFKSEMKEAGFETASLTRIMKDNIGAFTNWYFIGGAVSSLVGNFKSAISTIKEVDTLLTEISKTSNISGSALKELGTNAYDYASKYGSTVQGYLAGVQEMSRAGYDEKQAKALAELSILAQSAGDMTAELANQYLIATNFAYGYNGSIEKLNAVLDSQNQITNRNAVNMTELAEATKVAGSQAAQSGVDVDELTSAVGTMMTVTQQGGDIAGRAFKGILMNLQQVSGEIDGEIIDQKSFKKVESTLNSVGVSMETLVDGAAKLRDPIEVLKDLAKVYNSLPDGSVNKAAIINDLGGKYRGNQLSALLSNWNTYEKMMSDYNNANGSALAEAEKTANSLEGRLNKLSNTWNQTVNNVVDSDLLKFFVTAGTYAVDFANKTNILQTALIGLGGFGAYKGLTSFIPMIKNSTSSTIAFGNALNMVKVKDFEVNSTNLSRALSGLSKEQMVSVLSTKSLSSGLALMSESQIAATLSNAGLSSSEAATTAKTIALSGATVGATGSNLGFAASLKAVGAAMLSNPVGLAIGVITAGISAFSYFSSKYKQDQEEMITKNEQLSQSYREASKSLEENTNAYKDLQEKLRAGNLSTDESKSIKEQLISIQDSLVESYGKEAKGLDLLNGKYKEQLELLDGMAAKKADEYLAQGKLAYDESKKYLSDKHDYRIGDINGFSLDNDIQKYLQQYKDIKTRIMGDRNGETFSQGNIEITLDEIAVEDAYKTLTKLYNDIDEKFGNGKDAEKLKRSISELLNKQFDSEKTKKSRDTIEFFDSLFVENDKTLAPLYKDAKQAVEDYNNALSSGVGVAEAESNLNKVEKKVSETVKKFKSAKDTFQKVFDGVSKKQPTSPITTPNKAQESVPSFNTSSYLTSQKESIDDFQSSVEKVKSSLETLRNGTLTKTGVVDLIQEFGLDPNSIDMSTNSFAGLKSALESVVETNLSLLTTSLSELKEKGDITNEEYEKMSSIFQSLADDIGNTDKSFGSLSNSIDSLKSLDDTFSSLQNSYNKLKSKEKLDISDISSLSSIFGETKGFDDFIKTASSAKSMTKDVQSAFDGLVNTYLMTSSVLDGVTEENKDFVISQLEQIGVTNAEAYVASALSGELDVLRAREEALAIEKQFATAKGYELTDATWAEINGFANLQGVSDLARQALAQLALEKININTNKLDLRSDIDQIAALANVAGASIGAIARLQNIKSVLSGNVNSMSNGGYGDKLKAEAEKDLASIQNGSFNYGITKQVINPSTFKKTPYAAKTAYKPYVPKSSGGGSAGKSGSKGGSGSKSTKNEFSKVFDWMENRVEKLKEKAQNAIDSVSKYFSYKTKNSKINIAIKANIDQKKSLENIKEAYEKKASKIGLSKKYRDLVNNGGIKIETIKNESLAKKIDEYTDWRDKAKKVKDEITEINEEVKKLKLQRLDNITDYFSEIYGILDSKKSYKESLIAKKEAMGKSASVSDYNYLIAQEKSTKNYKNSEYNAYKKELASQVKQGLSKSDPTYKQGISYLNQLKTEITQCETAMIEYNRSILELPISKLEKANEKLQNQLDLLEKTRTDYDSVIQAVTDAYDSEIESIQKRKDALNDEDSHGSYANRIKVINEEIEALQKTNDEREKALALQKAQYDLERAKNQKTTKVFRENQGWVYEADTDAIRAAQDTLDKLAFDKIIDTKESEIKSLEKAKESLEKSYDNQIEQLTNMKDKWSSIADEIEKAKRNLLADMMLPSGWKDRIGNGSMSDFGIVSSLYQNISAEIEDVTSQIESNEAGIQKAKELVDAYTGTAASFESANTKIKKIISDTSVETKAIQTRINASLSYADVWTKTKDSIITANTLLANAQSVAKDNEALVWEERLNAMKTYRDEYKKIVAEMSSSLQSMSAMQSQIASLQNSESPASKLINLSVAGVVNATKRHSGIETGFVGENSKKASQDALRVISLDKLSPDEIISILKKKEVVLNEGQQQNILTNMASSYMAGKKATMTNAIIPKNTSQPSFSVGEVHLHEVQNVDSLADSIIRDFLPTMNQKLYKN